MEDDKIRDCVRQRIRNEEKKQKLLNSEEGLKQELGVA